MADINLNDILGALDSLNDDYDDALFQPPSDEPVEVVLPEYREDDPQPEPASQPEPAVQAEEVSGDTIRLDQIRKAVSEVSEQAVRSQYVAAARPAFLSAKGLTPAERGTALHKFMLFSDYVRGKNDPAEELARMVRLGYLTGEEGGAVEIGKLQKFFSGGLAGRMFEALRQGNLHREVRFTMELPVREYDAGSECDGEGIVVQGVADCVMEEADGLVIVDYKTDRVTDGQELIDRYAGQLEMYARAMEKCFHRPVKEHILYSFALGKEVKISVEG